MKQSISAESEQQSRQSQYANGKRSQATRLRSFVDNRPETIAQRRLIDTINASPQIFAQRKLAESFHESPNMIAQRNQSRTTKISVRQMEDRMPVNYHQEPKYKAGVTSAKATGSQSVERMQPDTTRRSHERKELLKTKAALGGVAQRNTWFHFKTKTLDYDDGSGINKSTDVGEVAEAWIDPSNPVVGTETPTRTGVFKDLNLIQGHLVNAQVGGPGVNQNFFPITASMNANHKNNIELPLKYKVLELDHLQKNTHGWANRHLYYKVSVTPPKWNGFTASDADNTVFNTDIAITNAKHEPLTSFGVGVGGITATDVSNLAHETLDTRLAALGMGANKPTSPSFGLGKTYQQGAPAPNPPYKVGSYYLMKAGNQIGVVEP
ncbi:MAG: hypothetical protein JSR71_07655 [Proteobacteria bacterium]|nr:hypothetical protein [Pseudomonadota bacterium]